MLNPLSKGQMHCTVTDTDMHMLVSTWWMWRPRPLSSGAKAHLVAGGMLCSPSSASLQSQCRPLGSPHTSAKQRCNWTGWPLPVWSLQTGSRKRRQHLCTPPKHQWSVKRVKPVSCAIYMCWKLTGNFIHYRHTSSTTNSDMCHKQGSQEHSTVTNDNKMTSDKPVTPTMM